MCRTVRYLKLNHWYELRVSKLYLFSTLLVLKWTKPSYENVYLSEMKTYEEVPLIQDSLQNLNAQSNVDMNVVSLESMSDLERQSSTDTSNFESGSEG